MLPQDFCVLLIGQMCSQHALIGLSQFLRTMLLHLFSLHELNNLQQFYKIGPLLLLLHREVLTEIGPYRIHLVLLLPIETTEHLRRVSLPK